MQKSYNHSTNLSASDISKNIGLTLMSLAMTLGMVELSTEHSGNKVVAHSQPAFAAVTESAPGESHSTQRNERQEAGPHYVSYSAAQRTPGRTGLV